MEQAADALQSLIAERDELDHECQYGMTQIRENLHRAEAAEAKMERAMGALHGLADDVEGARNLITHPHGRRADFIDSQDQIRVETLTAMMNVIANTLKELSDAQS